jgi:hypothetical protein
MEIAANLPGINQTSSSPRICSHTCRRRKRPEPILPWEAKRLPRHFRMLSINTYREALTTSHYEQWSVGRADHTLAGHSIPYCRPASSPGSLWAHPTLRPRRHQVWAPSSFMDPSRCVHYAPDHQFLPGTMWGSVTHESGVAQGLYGTRRVRISDCAYRMTSVWGYGGQMQLQGQCLGVP